jgi:hypothetical protein
MTKINANCLSIGLDCASIGTDISTVNVNCLSVGLDCASIGSDVSTVNTNCLSIGLDCASIGEDFTIIQAALATAFAVDITPVAKNCVSMGEDFTIIQAAIRSDLTGMQNDITAAIQAHCISSIFDVCASDITSYGADATGFATHTDVTDARGELSADLTAMYAAIATDITGETGAGAITHTYTLTDSVTGLPIADAQVWATTDAAGANVVASGTTTTAGVVVFYLDAGTYYFWRQKDGYNFINPDTESVV